MRVVGLCLFLALLGLTAGGCISPDDPLGRGDALKEAQRKYTNLIRWGDVEKAASYVDPELRESFLEVAKSFESIRITDYELGELDIPDLETAEIVVTYKGYVMPHFLEKEVSEIQVWYRAEGFGNNWRVRPKITELVDSLGGKRR